MKVVSLNPTADTKLIEREASRQMIQKFLRRDQKRINKKYGINGTMETNQGLPRLRG